MSDDRFERGKKRWEPIEPEEAPEEHRKASQVVANVFGPVTAHYERLEEKYEVDLTRDKCTLERFLFGEFDQGRFNTPTIKTLLEIYKRPRMEAIFKKWKEERGKK